MNYDIKVIRRKAAWAEISITSKRAVTPKKFFPKMDQRLNRFSSNFMKMSPFTFDNASVDVESVTPLEAKIRIDYYLDRYPANELLGYKFADDVVGYFKNKRNQDVFSKMFPDVREINIDAELATPDAVDDGDGYGAVYITLKA